LAWRRRIAIQSTTQLAAAACGAKGTESSLLQLLSPPEAFSLVASDLLLLLLLGSRWRYHICQSSSTTIENATMLRSTREYNYR
jgi:hypothetical protein